MLVAATRRLACKLLPGNVQVVWGSNVLFSPLAGIAYRQTPCTLFGPRTIHKCAAYVRLVCELRYYMGTRVREFEMHLRRNVLLLLYQNTWYQVYSTR